MIKSITQTSLVLAALCSSPLAADDRASPSPDGSPAAHVSEERLRADIDTLVGFGTRHTLSEQDNPERGIGAAVDWALNEFNSISAQCDDCLDVLPVADMVSGRRIAQPTLLRNAVAIQRGSQRPNEVIIVQAHIDSRASDALDWKSDAPGANDDGSGSVLVLETARALSANRYPTTIIYALLSGEEQGLYGGRVLADWVEAQGFTVKAVLNNDVVGNSCGSDGFCDAEHVRIFSEGPRADLSEAARAAQRRSGGENDSPGRNLSRWIGRNGIDHPVEMRLRQIWRTDRMGRGGDQIPFLEKGYPAVRITVAVEDYEHQHQDIRVEDGVTYGDTADEMDFEYLAKVTRINVRAIDKLAQVPMPPVVTAQAAVRTDTLLTWDPVPGADFYRLLVRRTDEANWRQSHLIGYGDENFIESSIVPEDPGSGGPVQVVVPLRGDDWLFGVASCSENLCGPAASAVPAGGFSPVARAEGDSE